MGSLLCFSPTSFAAINYFELTLEQLLETKVESVSKRKETMAEAPTAVYVITNEDIARAGVTTIPDALRMAPGVNVARSDNNSWAISIRGFNSTLANKLLVLVDGRSIYNPVFGGVLWGAHDLLLEDIESIEVIRGPGGTLWGANAVNGVINIKTKHTRATQGTLLSAIVGDEEQGTLNARHGAAFGDDNFYRVYAKVFQRDASYNPLNTSLDPSKEDHNVYDEWDGFRTGFRMDWSDEFTLSGDAYRSNTQQRRVHFSLIEPYMPIENQQIKYEGVNLLGRWIQKYNDGGQLSVQTYIDWAKRDEPINFIDDRITYDAEAQYDFAPFAGHQITTGLGIRLLHDDQEGDENVSFSPSSRRNNLYSAFLQDKITLVNQQWFLTLGSKFEHNDFSGTEVQPNARLQWQLNENQHLWAAVSRAVRTPTPIEEDLTSTLLTREINSFPVRAAFVPNDDFKSEKLIAYELGYRNQMTPKLSADIATFYNDYERLQTTTTQPPAIVNNGVDPVHFFLPIKFTNHMQGKSYGVEAAFNWQYSADLKLAANYSYLHLLVTALNPEQEGAEDIYPAHQLSTHIFWNINSNWTLDTSVFYIDELTAFNVDDYVRTDINLGGKINKNLRLNLVGQNLFDRSHREFGNATDLNAAEIEQSVFAKLTWNF